MTFLQSLARLFGTYRAPATFPATPVLAPAIPVSVGSATPKPPMDRWQGDVPREAVELSAAFEACRLKPYDDGYGFATIGFGSRTYLDGRPVKLSDPPITLAVAEAMTSRDLGRAAALTRAAVKVPLSNRQAAALILLANNLGSLTAAAPTLVNLVNSDNWPAAAEQFKAYRISAGRPSLGLRRRRWTEAAFSLGMDAKAAYDRAWAEITTADGWPKLPG
ncbi:lysozyme [Roseomonas xinghualingensis]|uniref:lysozyme n=1 Tax=Roseomonas xinghualingensis TaxID=2986475 RepID=UPI0021F16371|nr:lysozyme [Roseomonas sp. SXEYE001]MCV4210000.1 lysozyme [Roseomonas sp. SXEYE001]